MATTAVVGPTNPPTDPTFVPVGGKTFLGAGAAWAAGNDLAISPPCRSVRVRVGGTLHVTYSSGMTDSFPVADGEEVLGSFTTIFADSVDVEDLTIRW